MSRFSALPLPLLLLLLAGCTGPGPQAAAVQQTQPGNRLTLGTVQRQLHVGMTDTQVTEALGAPNMVTTDENRREVWVYDKIATDAVASDSYGGVGIPLIAGVGGGAAAQSTSQRTLTVIVKFDDAHRVRDYSYRSSAF